MNVYHRVAADSDCYGTQSSYARRSGAHTCPFFIGDIGAARACKLDLSTRLTGPLFLVFFHFLGCEQFTLVGLGPPPAQNSRALRVVDHSFRFVTGRGVRLYRQGHQAHHNYLPDAAKPRYGEGNVG